jgi:hypothetical protein
MWRDLSLVKSAALVALHEAAVADDIGGENGCKAALSAFFDHILPLRLMTSDNHL